jgi:anthranilate phosphoribosyltransferase
VELKDGKLSKFDVTPADAGLKISLMEDLKGGDPAVNAVALKGVLQGAKNAYRDIAVLNAAAGLIVADKALSLADAARMAEAAIDSGKAMKTLEKLTAISNG